MKQAILSQLNRRQFLRQSAGVAGLIAVPDIIPSAAIGADGTVAPSNWLTLASIGLGIQGTSNLRAFLAHPEARVIGVCDVHATQLAKGRKAVNDRYGNQDCAVYSDYRELLARQDLDAVVIGTPDHWHPLIAVEAARQGKHLYCEKPMGWSFRAAQAVRNAVHQHKVVFQFGTQQRSDRRFWRACSLVRGGRIGKLQTILVGVPGSVEVPAQPTEPVPQELDYDRWLGPAPWAPYSFERCRPYTARPGESWTRNYSSWYHISDYCVGFIGNWGIHHLDIAQWGHGSEATGPVEIVGAGEFPKAGLGDCALRWQVENRFADGVMLVHMDDETSKKHPLQKAGKGHGILFLGTDGWIHVDRGSLTTQPEALSEAKLDDAAPHLFRSDHHQNNFVAAARRQTQPASAIDVAVRSDTLYWLDQIAIKLRRKLAWNPVKEDFVDDAEASRMLDRPMRAPWKL